MSNCTPRADHVLRVKFNGGFYDAPGIMEAGRKWMDVADVEVVHAPENPNVTVSWKDYQETNLGAYTCPSSGIGSVTLTADYKGQPFDPGSKPYHVAMHEFGHALGLSHSPDDQNGGPAAVMDPTLDTAYTEPQPWDIERVQAIYGQPGGAYVYRAFIPGVGHIWTASKSKRNGWAGTAIVYEGIGFDVHSDGDPVYVLQHQDGNAFLTASQHERDNVAALEAWGYVETFRTHDVVHRFFYAQEGKHFCTRNSDEISALQADPDWTDEGRLT